MMDVIQLLLLQWLVGEAIEEIDLGGMWHKKVAGSVGTQITSKGIVLHYHPWTQTKEVKEGVEGDMEEEEQAGEEEAKTTRCNNNQNRNNYASMEEEKECVKENKDKTIIEDDF